MSRYYRTFSRRRLLRPRLVISFVPLLVAAFACSPSPANVGNRIPPLPEGAMTRWKVSQPEEIIGWVLFDPATVEHWRPPTLRFITVGEMAADGVDRAAEFLSAYPMREHWGVSIVEIVRQQTFTIDGEEPNWPENGAAALWVAPVAPLDSAADLGPGLPLLALEVWIPDSAYVAAMRAKGHYATYGNVTLTRVPSGMWQGSIEVDGLRATVDCVPVGPVEGGPESSGMQTIMPRRTSAVTAVVRIAYAGHRIRQCDETGSWSIQGTHPLAEAITAAPSELQYGYELVGGAYPK